MTAGNPTSNGGFSNAQIVGLVGGAGSALINGLSEDTEISEEEMELLRRRGAKNQAQLAGLYGELGNEKFLGALGERMAGRGASVAGAQARLAAGGIAGQTAGLTVAGPPGSAALAQRAAMLAGSRAMGQAGTQAANARAQEYLADQGALVKGLGQRDSNMLNALRIGDEMRQNDTEFAKRGDFTTTDSRERDAALHAANMAALRKQFGAFGPR